VRPTVSGLSVASRCHHNDGMADWQRLGKLVIARRINLGHRRREDLAAAVDGISMRTLGDIETGKRERYHPNTVAALENALLWTPGSVDTILEGGDPTERPATGILTPPKAVVRAANDDALIRVMGDDRISDRDKMRIAKILIDERERFERERVSRAEELIRAFHDDEP
jgi:hypothetical protein